MQPQKHLVTYVQMFIHYTFLWKFKLVAKRNSSPRVKDKGTPFCCNPLLSPSQNVSLFAWGGAHPIFLLRDLSGCAHIEREKSDISLHNLRGGICPSPHLRQFLCPFVAVAASLLPGRKDKLNSMAGGDQKKAHGLMK